MTDNRTRFIAEKMRREWSSEKDDLKRSKMVTNFYFSKILRYDPNTKPTETEYKVTDGTKDGGLDGYFLDRVQNTLYLVQTKWYSESKKKISHNESTELLNFCERRLIPNERGGSLSGDVKSFIGRYHRFHSGAVLKLIYLTNSKLAEGAEELYEKAGFHLEVIDLDKMSQIYGNILSEQVRIETEGILSLAIPDLIEFKTRYPLEGVSDKVTSVHVVQCAIRGIDLKRFFDSYNTQIFARNLRFGLTGRINQGIRDTARSRKRSAFYVLHNGISIICKKYRVIDGVSKTEAIKEVEKINRKYVPYVENALDKGVKRFIWLDEFQIINGAQTTITLSAVDDAMLEEIMIPCKISRTAEDEVSSQVAICNNTQNKIGPWDLVANSEELTLLQSYAALAVDPPYFISRRRGEKWVDLPFMSLSAPPKERRATAQQVYQAFLAFNGSPGQAYLKKGTVLNPERQAFREISSYADLDLIIAAGFIPALEKAATDDNDDDFTKYWTLWTIAAYGHLYNTRALKHNQQQKAKRRLLSSDAVDYWKEVRKYLLGAFGEFLATEFPESDHQRVLRNVDEEWGKFRKISVQPDDIWPNIDQNFIDDNFPQMRRKQGSSVSIEYYEVNFAILAKFLDGYVTQHKPTFI